MDHEQKVKAALSAIEDELMLADSSGSERLLGSLCGKLAAVKKQCAELHRIILKLAGDVDQQMDSVGKRLPTLIWDIVEQQVNVSGMNASVEESKQFLLRQTQMLISSVEDRSRIAETAMAVETQRLRDCVDAHSAALDEKLRNIEQRQQELEALHDRVAESRSESQEVLADLQSRMRNLQKKEARDFGHIRFEDLIDRFDALESRLYALEGKTSVSNQECSRRLEEVSLESRRLDEVSQKLGSGVASAMGASSDALRLLSGHVDELFHLERKANAACAMARRSRSAGSSGSSSRSSSFRRVSSVPAGRGRSAIRGDGGRACSLQPPHVPVKISEVQARTLSRYLGHGYEHVHITFR